MANVLDFVVAAITFTIQCPDTDVFMCWFIVCVCVHACMGACVRAYMCTSLQSWMYVTNQPYFWTIWPSFGHGQVILMTSISDVNNV